MGITAITSLPRQKPHEWHNEPPHPPVSGTVRAPRASFDPIPFGAEVARVHGRICAAVISEDPSPVAGGPAG
ncbi:hypothetical protein GCM10010518_11140 [Kitasatospora cinereorecta]